MPRPHRQRGGLPLCGLGSARQFQSRDSDNHYHSTSRIVLSSQTGSKWRPDREEAGSCVRRYRQVVKTAELTDNPTAMCPLTWGMRGVLCLVEVRVTKVQIGWDPPKNPFCPYNPRSHRKLEASLDLVVLVTDPGGLNEC